MDSCIVKHMDAPTDNCMDVPTDMELQTEILWVSTGHSPHWGRGPKPTRATMNLKA